jgi:hypothetical protein
MFESGIFQAGRCLLLCNPHRAASRAIHPDNKRGVVMHKRIVSAWSHPLVCAAGVSLLAAAAPAIADDVAHWQTVVGLIQPGNLVGSGTGGVLGGGQPWTTAGGEAGVNLINGNVGFRVRGLVFAGGNAVGTTGPISMVKGTLVCDTDGSAGGGNSTLVDTPLVPLSATGDAQFSGNLGPLPPACAEPDIVFVIRISAGRWIANGAVLRTSGN